ncbi:hypothetical protein ACFX1W_032332 [Malus domestica]
MIHPSQQPTSFLFPISYGFLFFEVIGFSECQSSNIELTGEALEVIRLSGLAEGDADIDCEERRDGGLGGHRGEKGWRFGLEWGLR